MIKRERYLRQIRPFIGKDIVKVLTGIRDSGKSAMLSLIQDELAASGISRDRFIVLNFEQMPDARINTAESLHDTICQRLAGIQGKAYLFLDEIQEVDGWERCVASLRVEADCDINIACSNAKGLSGELATYLAGRYVDFTVYPFSFSEFLDMGQKAAPHTGSKAAFRQYCQLGGMPFLSHLMGKLDASRQYLEDVGQAILFKAMSGNRQVRDVSQLVGILRYILAHLGQPLSATSLSKSFKNQDRTISTETVLNYIRFLTDASVLYKVSREDLVTHKVLTVNEKFYVADHGLCHAFCGNIMEDIEPVLENMVYLECLRRGYTVTTGKVGTKEIDFIARKHNTTLYIQVAYLLASPDTIEREFGVYSGVKDNYHKFVVSLDEWDMSRDGIKHCNIRDFLLKDDWA